MAGRRTTATMELVIGATIIAAILLLVVMLMAWGNNTSFLSRHYRVVVNMTNVGGLKVGAPVKLGGFQIGRVASIQIRPGGTDMEIILDIDEERLLPKGSTARVSTAGLVGDAFMEIVPGKSSESIKRAATVADAERIDSAPQPDITALMTKVDQFGDQLISLSEALNDIFGNEEFRRNVKDLAVNINAVSQQASQVLQRGQNLMGSMEQAAQNVVDITGTLKENVGNITANLNQVTAKAKDIADKARASLDNLDGGITEARGTLKDVSGEVKTAVTKLSDDLHGAVGKLSEDLKGSVTTLTGEAKAVLDKLSGDINKAVANLDGGIADARTALGKTLGNPEVQENLNASVKNIREISATVAQRREALDKLLTNLESLSGDLKEIGGKMRAITDRVEPKTVSDALTAMTASIQSLSDVVEKIKAEPVLALSVNKAADRIVKMKFDEMARQQRFKTSDEALDEINRWIRDSLRRGLMSDPLFPEDRRPYVIDSAQSK